MADEGLIDSAPGRAFHKAGGVPKVTVLRVISIEDGQVARHARKLARRHPRAAAARDRARAALGAGAQRPHPRADRGSRRRPRRARDEEARALGRPRARRGQGGRRSPVPVAGRQARAARVRDHRPEGRPARRPRAGRARRQAAALHGARRRGARRSVRAAQLLDDRDPQAWAARRIPHRRDRRGQGGRDDRPRPARGPDPSADRRDRSRGRARP